MLSTIGQIATRVGNLDRAIAFYRDALGLPFLFRAPPGMAFFQCGPQMLLLGLPERPEDDHPGSVLYFDVADIEQVHEALSGRGVPFVDRPHLVHRTPDRELWLDFFHDPDRNLLALMSWKPKAG
jgi:methylmalonyl-CoA/ethylmalonyl-CoA epimerase